METQQNFLLQQARIAELERENARLRRELEFLRTHTSIAQGMRGETLIAKAIAGAVASYAASYDIETSSGKRIEIKFSKLNQPSKVACTRRWNWSKPLGWLDKGKDYDYLLLIGEKDERYLSQFLDETPYVYFLVPISAVLNLMDKGQAIGGMIQITSNLPKLRQKRIPPELLNYQRSFESLNALLSNATAA